MTTPKGKIVAYGYCRVSTEKQGVEGDSLDTQEGQIKAYAQAHNIELRNIYREVCSGGTHPKAREQLKAILKLFKKGQGNAIIVTKIDRLSRSLRDFFCILEDWEQEGINFICVQSGIDTSTAQGKCVIQMLCSINELERKQIAQRTEETMRHKYQSGHLLGTVPFGMKVEEWVDGTRILVPDEREQALIERAKELRQETTILKNGAERQRSYREICKIFEREGIVNKNGTVRWHPSQISRMCGDPEDLRQKRKERRDAKAKAKKKVVELTSSDDDE